MAQPHQRRQSLPDSDTNRADAESTGSKRLRQKNRDQTLPLQNNSAVSISQAPDRAAQRPQLHLNSSSPDSVGTIPRTPIVMISHKSHLNDATTGAAHRQLAQWLCKLPQVESLFTMFSTGRILDNKAGQGIVSQELLLKTSDELFCPIIHTCDPHLHPTLVPQADIWTLRPCSEGAFPINCARMPLTQLDYPDGMFDVVITMGNADYFNKPPGHANIPSSLPRPQTWRRRHLRARLVALLLPPQQ